MFGASLFFTFVVGPALFSGFDPKNAAYVMNLIFPYYFKLGWVGGIMIYTLVGIYSYFNRSVIIGLKYFMFALFVLVIINMALDRAVLPLSNGVLDQYYEALRDGNTELANTLKQRFDKLHTVSYWLNLIHILILFYLMYVFFKFRDKMTKIC